MYLCYVFHKTIKEKIDKQSNSSLPAFTGAQTPVSFLNISNCKGLSLSDHPSETSRNIAWQHLESGPVEILGCGSGHANEHFFSECDHQT